MTPSVFGKLKVSRFIDPRNRNLSHLTCRGIIEPPLGNCPRKAAALLDLEDWTSIRWLHLREGKSQRWIAKEFGISRNTVAKYIQNPDPPKYTTKVDRSQPLRQQLRPLVEEMLAEDTTAPRKQKHTAKRVFDRLVTEHGYSGSLRTVQYLVTELHQNSTREAILPLSFDPGNDAQVDFSESVVELDGRRQKVFCFEMRLNYSRKKFLMAFPAANREAFLEGHVQAFEYFGGVPSRISYDNLRAAVIKILRGKQRHLTDSFKELAGFYSFEHNFCTPYKAHEKGGIESSVGFSRRNWLVPVPKFSNLLELNDYLRSKCDEENQRTVAGTDRRIGEAWEIEKSCLLKLPSRAFLPVTTLVAKTDKYSTVCFQTNRYSVPPAQIGKRLWLKVMCTTVAISDGKQIICEHPRSYGRNEFELKPEHYLDVLDTKPNAIPYARPLLEFEWPDGYWQYYQKLKETSGASDGGRQFLQILRSHTQFGGAVVGAAVKAAAEMRIFNADAVISIVHHGKRNQLVPAPLTVAGYQSLADRHVELPEASQYNSLLEGEHVNDSQCIA